MYITGTSYITRSSLHQGHIKKRFAHRLEAVHGCLHQGRRAGQEQGRRTRGRKGDVPGGAGPARCGEAGAPRREARVEAEAPGGAGGRGRTEALAGGPKSRGQGSSSGPCLRWWSRGALWWRWTAVTHRGAAGGGWPRWRAGGRASRSMHLGQPVRRPRMSGGARRAGQGARVR